MHSDQEKQNDAIQSQLSEIEKEAFQLFSLLESSEIINFLRTAASELDRESLQILESVSKYKSFISKINLSDSYTLLKEIHTDLTMLQLDEFLATRDVMALHKSCTEYRDLIASRVFSLVSSELKDKGLKAPEIPFSLLSMGSDGRKEQTLITDQDYLIVYGDGAGEYADEYFRQFSELLVERMAEVGFKKCTGNIMPSNPTWRGSHSQWRKKLLSIVRYEYEDYAKNLMDLIVLSDARYVAGDRELAENLIDLISSLERDYFQVLYGMAKAASEMKLALGFLHRLWTEGSGDHKGEFNLKLIAWAPLVMNVRILAINQAISETSTVGRVLKLGEIGSISKDMAKGLTESYRILTTHRVFLQIKEMKGIQKDSYYLNPYLLPTEEREAIRQSLLRIEELQKIIHTNFNVL